jgi:hypothetical protein
VCQHPHFVIAACPGHPRISVVPLANSWMPGISAGHDELDGLEK